MTSDPITASPDGTYIALADGRYTVRFERRLDHPIERVWSAITEPDEILRWLGEAELDLTEGGTVVVRWLNSMTKEQIERYGIEGQEEGDVDEQQVMRGTVARLEPPRLIEYETDTFGELRFELRAEGDGCVLTFSNTVEVPAEQLTQMMAGWHIHLEHLEDALAGGRIEWSTWADDHLDRWAELRDRYEAKRA